MAVCSVLKPVLATLSKNRGDPEGKTCDKYLIIPRAAIESSIEKSIPLILHQKELRDKQIKARSEKTIQTNLIKLGVKCSLESQVTH